MKKKSKPSSKIALAASLEGGTCVYMSISGEFVLVEDHSEPGFHCDDSLGPSDDDEGTLITTSAISDEPGEDGGEDGGEEGGGDGGGEEGGGEDGGDGGGQSLELKQSRRAKLMALPKNSALYEFQGERKVLRRVRGAWRKGHYTPLEMTLKELAKFAPKVRDIVNAMAKNRSIVSFQVVVPSQKLPPRKERTIEVTKRATTKGTIAKKEISKASKPVAAKQAKQKLKKKKKT